MSFNEAVFFVTANVSITPVAFTACKSKDVHLGGKQAVLYDRVVTNIGGAYESRDGHFSAPMAGLYTFTFTGATYGNDQGYLNLVKNGVFLVQIYSNDGYAELSSETAHVHLDVGDRVWVENVVNGQHLHGGYNCFSGILNTAG